MGLSDSEDENGFTSLTRVPSQRMTREEYEHREKKRWEEEQQQKAREDKKRQEKQRQHSIKQEETATTSRSSSRPVSPSSRKSKSPEIQHQPARGPAPVRKETDERDTYNLHRDLLRQRYVHDSQQGWSDRDAGIRKEGKEKRASGTTEKSMSKHEERYGSGRREKIYGFRVRGGL